MNGSVSPEEAVNIIKTLFIRPDRCTARIFLFGWKWKLKELLGRSIIFFPAPIVSVYRILDSKKN